MKKEKEETQMLNKQEAANRLRIACSTLDRHVRKGLLTSIKLGNLVFFREKDLDQFVRSCERRPRRHVAETSKTITA